MDPIFTEGHKHALCCADGYSGLLIVYLLKQKGDAIRAFKKFLADVNPYISHSQMCMIGSGRKIHFRRLWIPFDTKSTMEIMKEVFKQKIFRKDFGQMSSFLGIELEHEESKITMNQSKYRYLKRLLNRFGTQNCKPKHTP